MIPRIVPTLAALVVLSAQALAQGTSPRGFAPGYTDIGVTVGLGNIGNAGLSFGGRFERALKQLPDLGDGTLGIQLSADYWSYGERFASVDYDFTYIAFGGTANYHFKTQNRKVDPFVGAGLGFSSASTKYTGSYSSGIYFVGRAGLRYFLKEKMALYADAGAGAAALNVGLTFGVAPAR